MDEAAARRLRQQLMALRRRLRAEASGELPWSLAEVLGTVDRLGAASPSQVAAELGQQRPNVTPLLRELTSLGLLSRCEDPADGRRAIIRVTPLGAAVVERDRGSRERWLVAAASACLTPAEDSLLRAAGELMQRLADWEASGGTG